MDKENILKWMEMLGEVDIVVGAAAWMFVPPTATVFYVVGTVAFALGRFLQTPLYTRYSKLDKRELVLRRLYHQRVFGIVALILSAALMCTPPGFYYDIWIGKNSWLIMFIPFSIIEVITSFRLMSIMKD